MSQLKEKQSFHMMGLDCITHIINLVVKTLFNLLMVVKLEDLL
jgi:hypothetical protein